MKQEDPTSPRGVRFGRRAGIFALLAAGSAYVGWKFLAAPAPPLDTSAAGRDFENFRFIYESPERRAEFRRFLANVFHLYPEAEFDALIAESVARDPRDPAVYRRLEANLAEIAPTLGLVRYSLPALQKQKAEMAAQTARLLGEGSSFHGYLEIGSHGRYLDQLKERVNVAGPVYTTSFQAPTYSPADVVDRGQISQVGTVLPWTDYAPLTDREIEPESLDLITVYIGLHHTTEEARAPYARSLRRALSKNGKLIVRDHDVRDDSLRHLVGLAHDVFNVGTGEAWSTNENERRNFYSLATLVALLESEGFVAHPERLLQDGDPTQNTLLCFSKA